MPDLRERFIELALRPLAGRSPAEDLARGELMERLNHSRPEPGDDSLEAATARLEAAPGRRMKRGLQAALLLLGFVAILGAMANATWRDLVRIDFFYDVLPGRPDHLAAVERELAARVPDEDRLFLFANSATMGSELRSAWREHCEKHPPEDPGWLEEYAVGGGLRDRPLRERVLEQARKIDAGNGLWDLREASAFLGRSQFKYFNSKPRSSIGPAFPVLTTDASFQEAVALMEKAVRSPRFETRIPARNAKRLQLLGPATTWAELVDRRMFVRNQFATGSYTQRWGEFWEARMHELEKADDREGLRRWFETLARLHWRCLKESGDERLYNVCLIESMRSFHDFRDLLQRLALYDEAATMDHWERTFPYSTTVTASGAEELYQMAAAPVQDDWLRYAEAGLVGMSELEPGRRAEHAMADRMLAVAAAILFGMLAWLACLEGWRRAQPVGGLADGVGELLRPSDFAWICVLGIALPAVWHVAIAGISPLGWRDYSITVRDMKPLVLRATGSFLFAACMLVQAARWRLSKRGGVLGFRVVLWPGWAVAVIAALFVPTIGAVRYMTKGQDEFLKFGSAAAGLPLLWLAWRSFALILSPRAVALPGVLVCRMLMSCFITASMVLLAAAFLLKREESKWVRRDTLIHATPGGSGMTVVETRRADAMRDRLLRALETAPATK